MNKPRYIAVEGPIGVGKTTLAKRLSAEFGAELLLERAEDNPFLPQFYARPRRYALATQLFFLMQRAEQLRDLRQADLFSSVRVADFILDKDRLFAELTLAADELTLYEQVHAHVIAEIPEPDVVIFLQAPVNVLLERIGARGLEYERAIDADYLTRLAQAYSVFFRAYERAPLLVVNAADIDLAHGDGDYEDLLLELDAIHSGRRFFHALPW